MFDTGATLRSRREAMGLSQARVAEISGVPQHALSAFELGKGVLKADARARIGAVLGQDGAPARRKRYRTHSFDGRGHDPRRVARHAVSPGNAAYRAALGGLAAVPPTFTGLSLFSGCGGFSLGFRAAGCAIKGFVEIDDGLSGIYRANVPQAERLGGCIRGVSDADLRGFADRHGPIDVVIGGPPCQGFSLAGKRDVGDPRNGLFHDYVRVLASVRPQVAILENVRLLTSMRLESGGLVRDEIAAALGDCGYDVGLFAINATDYGVPQHRERVLFVAVDRAIGRPPSIPAASHGAATDLIDARAPVRSFADACSDLAFLESGEADAADPLHAAVRHPDHVVEWLWDVAEGRSAHDNADPGMRPPSGYNTTYKRQVWNEPGATVQTTFGMISGCRNVHPIATRALSVREAARLQSFPDDVALPGSLGTVRTGIGNAVPPLLARALGVHVRDRLLA